MSEDISQSLNILTLLRSINSEPRGVSRSLSSTIDDDQTNDVKPTLTSNETTRIENIGLILGDAIGRVLEIGKYRKGPEARRLEDLTPSDSKITGTTANVLPTALVNNNGSNNSFSLLDMLGIGALLYSLLQGNFSGIAQSIYRAIAPKLKLLKNAFTKRFNALKTTLSKTYKSIKGYFDDTIKSIKNSKFFTRLTESVNKYFTSALNSIKNSKFITSLSQKVGLWKQTVNSFFGAIKNNITSIADTVSSGISSAVKAVNQKLLKTGAGAAISAGISSASNFFTKAGSAIKRGASFVGRSVLEPLKNRALAQAGRIIGKKGGERAFLSFLRNSLGKIPLAGPFIELLFGSGDIKSYKQEYQENKIDLNTLQQKSGNRVLEGLMGLLGGAGGAALGTVIGGPLGTFLGSIAGDVAGRYLIAPIAKAILPESSLKKIGSIVTGTEMQDFLVKEGKVYSFSSKDEVLGMKTGGAIDNLMKDLTVSISKDNKLIKQALFKQIEQQETVIDVLTAILNKREAPIVVNSQQKYSDYISNDFRGKFAYQTSFATP